MARYRCALKDQVQLIAKASATELAHPLRSRHARLAANIQPMTPRTKPQQTLHGCESEGQCQWGGASPGRLPERSCICAFPGTLRRSCARANVISDPLPATPEQGLHWVCRCLMSLLRTSQHVRIPLGSLSPVLLAKPLWFCPPGFAGRAKPLLGSCAFRRVGETRRRRLSELGVQQRRQLAQRKLNGALRS